MKAHDLKPNRADLTETVEEISNHQIMYELVQQGEMLLRNQAEFSFK